MSSYFTAQTITLEAALRDVASGAPKARAMAAHALGEVTSPEDRPRAADALIKALDDDRSEVRAEAAAALGELGDARAIPGLIKRLNDGDQATRQCAAIALGTLRSPEAWDALVLALREGPADLRYQAASSLAEIDAPRSYEPLVAALGDAESAGAVRDRVVARRDRRRSRRRPPRAA